jgi:hypothetical protein
MLIMGVVSIAATVLALAALLPVFRAPRQAHWTRRKWVGEVITLAIVGGLTLGVAGFCAGAYRAYQSGLTLVDAGVVMLVVGLSVVLWRWLARRRQAAAPVTPSLVVTTAAPDPAPQEPQPPRPARPTRRAA